MHEIKIMTYMYSTRHLNSTKSHIKKKKKIDTVCIIPIKIIKIIKICDLIWFIAFKKNLFLLFPTFSISRVLYMAYRTIEPRYTLPYIPIRVLHHTKLQTLFTISSHHCNLACWLLTVTNQNYTRFSSSYDPTAAPATREERRYWRLLPVFSYRLS